VNRNYLKRVTKRQLFGVTAKAKQKKITEESRITDHR